MHNTVDNLREHVGVVRKIALKGVIELRKIQLPAFNGSLQQGVRTGESMAMGEKPTLALISPAASAKMAVAESLMNLIASDAHGVLANRDTDSQLGAEIHPNGLNRLVESSTLTMAGSRC